MSHGYQFVGWNRQKKIYDLTLLGGVIGYLVLFIVGSIALHPDAVIDMIILRALGTCAFVLLHVILAIGPLARLDRRWLPLLCNRRHMGVTMFTLALLHGLLSLMTYHGFGDTNPLVSLFTANTRFDSLSQFPFQPLGFFALILLFLMAATSHDFWLANLTPPVWKTLHMGVYLAYGLLLAHVGFGFLQTETHPALFGLLAAGCITLVALHLTAAGKERTLDTQEGFEQDRDGYLKLCGALEIPEKRGRIFHVGGDRIAVFRYDGNISAISNACQHQNGPLGEGRVIDGLVTCPWHGFQYDPATGASPPPFTEKVPTFRVKLVNGTVWVHPQPNPAGTRVEPAHLEEPAHA